MNQITMDEKTAYTNWQIELDKLLILLIIAVNTSDQARWDYMTERIILSEKFDPPKKKRNTCVHICFCLASNFGGIY